MGSLLSHPHPGQGGQLTGVAQPRLLTRGLPSAALLSSPLPRQARRRGAWTEPCPLHRTCREQRLRFSCAYSTGACYRCILACGHHQTASSTYLLPVACLFHYHACAHMRLVTGLWTVASRTCAPQATRLMDSDAAATPHRAVPPPNASHSLCDGLPGRCWAALLARPFSPRMPSCRALLYRHLSSCL